MLVFTLASLKGGVGKSTIALNLASVLHTAGHQVLLVDCDSQGTCQTWRAVGAEADVDGPPVVAVNGRSLRRDLPRVAKGFDVVVIDGPPRLGAETRATMLAADLVLMPVTPGAAEAWGLKETITVFEDAQAIRPELRAAIVLNRMDHTTLARVSKAALAESGVVVLSKTPLGSRVAFGEATARGMGVVHHAPRSAASNEVKALTRAVLAMVKS